MVAKNAQTVGTVISTMNAPNPSSVDFVVTSGLIHRGQFVEIENASGNFIALVMDVYRTNKYFERADSVKEFESKGQALFEQFPVHEWEYLVANTKPLGVYSGENFYRPSFPPSPGSKVKIADSDKLKQFFHFDENGLQLGNVEYHDLPVKLNMTRMLKKHLAIMAQSGSGKSFSTACLIEELLNRPKEKGRIAIVVLDPHGEYSHFAQPVKDSKFEDFSDKTKIIKAQNIRIAVPKMSVHMLAGIIPGLSAPQKRDLSRILSCLKDDMRKGLGPFDWSHVKDAILKDDNIKQNSKFPLMGWIDDLMSYNLFARTDMPAITELIKPGTLTIIDFSDVVNMKKKQMLVSYFANKMFDDRKSLSIPPTLLVVEEAHQFSPQMASEESAISRSIIRTIAREGRKFGLSLCIISQRPVQLDTTTLSQCSTHLILRITNPNDLKHIAESSEGIDQRSFGIINSLQVGEGLLVGEATGYPLFFKVRYRKSMPSKHEISLEDAALKFENSSEKKNGEAEEFLQ